jgi:hypothetical protein
MKAQLVMVLVLASLAVFFLQAAIMPSLGFHEGGF